jgi:hypothetical protein
MIRAMGSAGPQSESLNIQLLVGSIQGSAAPKEDPWKKVYEA